MSTAEIKNMPLSEKLLLMEALWEDLRSNADSVLIPDWHKELLDARQKAVETGQEEILDWDAVKDSLDKPLWIQLCPALILPDAEILLDGYKFT